jgi:hypothetical protein
MPATRGIRTAALSTRVLEASAFVLPSGSGARLARRFDSGEPVSSLMPPSDGPAGCRPAKPGTAPPIKVRPEGGCNIVLGIGRLPHHETAGAHLAAGTDDQIGVRLAGGVHVAGHRASSTSSARDRRRGGCAARPEQSRLAPSIVKGHVQHDAVVVARQLDGIPHLSWSRGGRRSERPT